MTVFTFGLLIIQVCSMIFNFFFNISSSTVLVRLFVLKKVSILTKLTNPIYKKYRTYKHNGHFIIVKVVYEIDLETCVNIVIAML